LQNQFASFYRWRQIFIAETSPIRDCLDATARWILIFQNVMNFYRFLSLFISFYLFLSLFISFYRFKHFISFYRCLSPLPTVLPLSPLIASYRRLSLVIASYRCLSLVIAAYR
jgi:hypothetical protein